jgi:integrating conjugative element protein (TIGR03757 family)
MPSYLLSILLASWLPISAASASSLSQFTAERITVDVFTASTQAIVIPSENNRDHDGITITIHELDHIERFNADLSKGLVRDPEIAKQQVLRRFKTLDKSHQKALQESAEALALALHLGVLRYPAIVLNSHWVVYGVLDVQHAIDLFWMQQRAADQ